MRSGVKSSKRRLIARLAAVLGFVLLSPLVGAPARAAVVGDPTGVMVNGWFKDSFQISIAYGKGNCTGPGTANHYVFTAGSANNGIHDYHFLADLLDNPFLATDSGGPRPLVMPPSCPMSQPSVVRD